MIDVLAFTLYGFPRIGDLLNRISLTGVSILPNAGFHFRAPEFRISSKVPSTPEVLCICAYNVPPTRKATLCGAALCRTRICGLRFVASPAQLPLTLPSARHAVKRIFLVRSEVQSTGIAANPPVVVVRE